MSGLSALGSVAELDAATTLMGTTGTTPPSQAEMAKKRKKCESLSGEARTECIAGTPTYAGKRRKTRARRRRSTRRRSRSKGGNEPNALRKYIEKKGPDGRDPLSLYARPTIGANTFKPPLPPPTRPVDPTHEELIAKYTKPRGGSRRRRR